MIALLKGVHSNLQADKVLQQFLTEFQRVFDMWQPNEAIFSGACSHKTALFLDACVLAFAEQRLGAICAFAEQSH